jgi:hypothetical protein
MSNEEAIMDTTEVSPLHYFRCDDCLGAFTIKEKDLPGDVREVKGKCICNGDFIHIGKVHDDHYQRTGKRAACDCRCTNAKGPTCRCRCISKNHGTGKLVNVVVEQGLVRVTTFNQELVDLGNEWRLLKKTLLETFEKRWGKDREVPYYEQRDAQKLLDRCLNMHRFSSRRKKAELLIGGWLNG